MSAVMNNMSFALYGLLYPVMSIIFNGNYIILNSINSGILIIAFLLCIFNIN